MAAISRYTKPIEQTLEQYVPLPMEEMMLAGQAIQKRGDEAMNTNIAVETGLGSMEALASGQSKFKDTYVNDYKKQAGSLLDKYNGNTSDPEFIRESRKLNLTFATDPRLQTLKQTNELLKGQQKMAQELSAKGIKYIDPNKGFTGVDQNGNLIAPTGMIKATNFDEEIATSFKNAAANMVDNGAGWKSNKQNLDKLATNFVGNINNNPATRDAIDYYKQQGMSEAQAKAATVNLVKQAYETNVKTDRDYAYDQLQISRANLALSQRKQAMDEQEFKMNLQAKYDLKKKEGMLPGLVPEVSGISGQDLNKSLIKDVDNIIGTLNKAGGLAKSKIQTIADTPENRKKYAGQFDEINKYGKSGGLGAPQPVIGKELRIKDQFVKGKPNPEHLTALVAARETLGSLAKNPSTGAYLKDATVLQRYKELLSKDNVAQTFWNTQSGDQLKQLDNVYVGSKGEKLGNATLIDHEGKRIKTASKDFDMSNYEGFSFSGISAAPSDEFPNGAIKVSAIDKDNGKIVQFLKPLDPQTAQNFTISNKGYRALMSQKGNNDIAKDKSLWIGDGQGGTLVPQRTPNGGVNLFYIDPSSGKRLNKDPLPFDQYVKEEHSNFTQYLSTFTNK